MRYIFTRLILVLSLGVNTLEAQNYKIKQAQLQYDNLSYSKAIANYERLALDGYSSAELFEHLGHSYYFLAEYSSAKRWYDSLFVLTLDVSSNTYHKYVNTLKASGCYELSDQWMDRMAAKYPKDNRVLLYKSDKLYLKTIASSVGVAQVKNAKINSKYRDFLPSFLSDSVIVFSSSRATNRSISQKHGWTDESHTNLYASAIVSDSTMGSVKSLNAGINKHYNESSAVFTKDGKTMYFTRNNQLRSRAKTDTLNAVLLKIYKATYNGKRWGNVKELPFNSDDFNCAHPALSPDEQYLYFSSDMPGTYGKSDLFRVAILEDDTYGTPENLGLKINTEGRDTFPFITDDSVLIFASDARPGLGGLDLYYVHLNSVSMQVKTFSSPINSSYDDFGLVYRAIISKGFLSSNRPDDDLGGDNIYRFGSLEIPGIFSVDLNIIDLEKSLPVDTELFLLDSNKQIIEKFKTENGRLVLPDLDKEKSYYVSVDAQGYDPQVSMISYNKLPDLKFEVGLVKKMEVSVGVDLAKLLDLKIIYFDFDKHFIRKDAALELENIFEIMQQYPLLKVAIRSHTDSRASKKYNMELSEKRAISTRKWLIDRGISSERLTAQGYGESNLENGCGDGVPCTEAQHQENRKSEFIIIE